MEMKCQKMSVPEEACYIWFGKGGQYHKSLDWNLETARGETIIIDLDKHGRVIGMELISGKKPCMRIEENHSKNGQKISRKQQIPA